jgi:hypothetical protein
MHAYTVAALKDLPINFMPPPAAAQSGRPSKTSTTQHRRLKSYLKQYTFKSARQLKNEVAGWADVLVRTIQDRLQKKLGLPLAFARKYKNWKASVVECHVQ